MDTKFFTENGYRVLRNFVEPKELFKHMKHLARVTAPDAYGKPSSTVFYKDAVFEKKLVESLPRVEEATGLKLFKTYSMGKIYKQGEVLEVHRDRPACEITLSISIGQEQVWPLWISDKDAKAVRVDLQPGDALMFRGITYAHWREKNVAGECCQLMLHYVDSEGPFASYRDDKKKDYGFNFKLFKRRVWVGVS